MTVRHAPYVAAFVVALFLTPSASAQCGVERQPVKTATDADAALVSTAAVPTQIAHLRSLPTVRPLPHARRIAPVETTTYSVTATLLEFRRTEASEYHLVLADEEGRTMIAKLPAPACSTGSRFAREIAAVRALFETRFAATDAFRPAMVPVEIRGIGFFDFVREQRGVAPNGIELHPVTDLSFHPLVVPRSPFASRKRAVGRGGSVGCTKPSLTLKTSKNLVCSDESVTLEWQASDGRATVTIDGVGTSLPSSGKTTLTTAATTVYSGRATNACGSGPEGVAMVSIQGSPSASLSGPASMTQGTSATLSFSTSGTTSWTLSSMLRNAITPSSGSGSGFLSGTYRADSTGTDTVTLTAGGSPCGEVKRSISILISTPPNQGLRCCDGSRSPTCFDCGNKRGCCSGHGGVCGC